MGALRDEVVGKEVGGKVEGRREGEEELATAGSESTLKVREWGTAQGAGSE